MSIIDLEQYGYIESEPLPDGVLHGRVTAVHKERYELVTSLGALFGMRNVAGDADIIPVSVVSRVGFDRLDAYLMPGKTVVFLGMSGVGKSSLLNALMGQEVMTVNDIREDDSRGRHTTTHRQLFMLPSGAMVIDTPGMRSLGMWDAQDGVSETFADVTALLGTCRFSDCRHQSEPGCAIRAAIESGEFPAERWERYSNLQREALYSFDKAAVMRERNKVGKTIAKWSRANKSAKANWRRSSGSM